MVLVRFCLSVVDRDIILDFSVFAPFLVVSTSATDEMLSSRGPPWYS